MDQACSILIKNNLLKLSLDRMLMKNKLPIFWKPRMPILMR
jgi:hypothetical protein